MSEIFNLTLPDGICEQCCLLCIDTYNKAIDDKIYIDTLKEAWGRVVTEACDHARKIQPCVNDLVQYCAEDLELFSVFINMTMIGSIVVNKCKTCLIIYHENGLLRNIGNYNETAFLKEGLNDHVPIFYPRLNYTLDKYANIWYLLCEYYDYDIFDYYLKNFSPNQYAIKTKKTHDERFRFISLFPWMDCMLKKPYVIDHLFQIVNIKTQNAESFNIEQMCEITLLQFINTTERYVNEWKGEHIDSVLLYNIDQCFAAITQKNISFCCQYLPHHFVEDSVTKIKKMVKMLLQNEESPLSEQHKVLCQTIVDIEI